MVDAEESPLTLISRSTSGSSLINEVKSKESSESHSSDGTPVDGFS